jgi:hypothetical protein
VASTWVLARSEGEGQTKLFPGTLSNERMLAHESERRNRRPHRVVRIDVRTELHLPSRRRQSVWAVQRHSAVFQYGYISYPAGSPGGSDLKAMFAGDQF